MHVQHPSPHHPLPPCRQSVTALILGAQPVYTSAIATLFRLCACLILLPLPTLLCYQGRERQTTVYRCCHGLEPVCPAHDLAASLALSFSPSHLAAPLAANMLPIVRVIMDTHMHEAVALDGRPALQVPCVETWTALGTAAAWVGLSRPSSTTATALHCTALHRTHTLRCIGPPAPGSSGQNSSVAGTRFFLRSNSAHPWTHSLPLRVL